MEDIKKSMKLVESFQAVAKSTSIQEMAQKHLVSTSVSKVMKESEGEDEQPYEEGYRAAQSGKSKSNPYDTSDPNGYDWEDGWLDGKKYPGKSIDEAVRVMSTNPDTGSMVRYPKNHPAGEVAQSHRDTTAKLVKQARSAGTTLKKDSTERVDGANVMKYSSKNVKNVSEESGAKSVNEVSLGNYTAKAAKSKAMAQMDKAFGYNGDGNSNADSTIKKRTAGLERAQVRTSKSKDAALAKAKEDRKASDIANKEKYEKQLSDLKGQFDKNYDRSDDHSYWTKHKEMAAQIKDLEKRLGGISEASGGAIEAYGVRGMNSKQWRKTFKSQAAFDAWLKLNDGDVEVHGTRNPNELDEAADSNDVARAPAKQDAKKLSESVDVASAITLSPDALMGILKLAGMQPYIPSPTAAPVTGVVSAMPSIAPQTNIAQPSMSALAAMIPDDLMVGDDCESEQGLEEAGIEYANSPDEEYCDTDELLKSGNDMHRSKGTHPKVAGGDNPMQPVEEHDDSISEQMQHSGQRTADSAGTADSYYGRARKPNKSDNGVKTYDLTPEEIKAYYAAYDANEEAGDFKDWGRD
ncbi:hypothetical protein UFOVP116_34 [uncultured Caudovirales phage]|uniref:Uncharacterized protein n=1 Tax=uncultured Caudovirales phage TaxID=2100421 RepID=A0A6J5L8G5_9CAUD|nr:hypothetical protein UFOVP116_34 [uncultured Caudovirales phage]